MTNTLVTNNTVTTPTEPETTIPSGTFAEKYAQTRKAGVHPLASAPNVPDGRYELTNHLGKPIFYEIRTGKRQWAGYQFVSVLQGSPNRWRRLPVKQNDFRLQVLAELSADPKSAAIRFSKRFKSCALCGSALTDPKSIERGLGEECVKKFPEDAAA